ncbi:phenylacetate--CoA ligase family protein [Comamonadaceae bacterium OH2545_COT-014]|nr:phenylacetate--CoA ligase family protein [Comamonadaceae bacterium OH2545_COT-014]
MNAVFDPLHLQAAILDVMAAGRIPPALLQQRQRLRLARLLDAARAQSAFYRKRLPRRADSLRHVPPVTRGELMAHFDTWVTDPALRLDELRAFTADASRLADPWQGRYVVWESSGTSGQPGLFVQDAAAMAVYDALEAVRHRVPPRAASGLAGGWFGSFMPLEWLGATDRAALVTATGGHFASVVTFERLRRINPWLAQGARSFSIMQPLPALVDELNAFQPTVLATYPTAAALLAEAAAQGALHIRPRHIITGGETLGAAARARITQAFGAPVRSSYGASECLTLAWECAHGHLHLNADWVLLEPVDERGHAVPPGRPSHSVWLTNLANLVQPLIRYDLDDRITLHAQPCACGSPLPVIDVHGRCDDVLRLAAPPPEGGTVSLLPLALTTVLEEAGLFDFQLFQQGPRTLLLRLPLTGAAATAAAARGRAALQAFAAAQGAPGVRVHVETGCDLPRGASGKACRILLE